MFTIEGVFYLDSFYSDIEDNRRNKFMIGYLKIPNSATTTGTDESETLVGTKINDIISGGKGRLYLCR